MKLQHHKLNIVIDGQFGSTGKGVLCSYLADKNAFSWCISNAGPNSGHTFHDRNGHTRVAKHLPVSGVLNENSNIYLCAGSIINVELLYKEMAELGVDHDRVFIHPRAAVISYEDILKETAPDGRMAAISSTQNGVGNALARKVKREAVLAGQDSRLKPFIHAVDMDRIFSGTGHVLMEVPQGFDLGINSGYNYPYCTSREVTVQSALSDAGVHPMYLGTVIVTLRTYPIRVGSLENGYSGPFYADSREVTWADLGVPPEMTTRTERIRRVATFSKAQYERMLAALKPDYIFMNFMNYCSFEEQALILQECPEVTHVGYGPRKSDIFEKSC